MRNNQKNIIDILRDRAVKENDILSGSIGESIEEKEKEIIKKTLKELPILEDIISNFKFDQFYIYIFSVPYFNYATREELHMCVQDKLADVMQQVNIATNFYSEPGYWYFDLVIPYDIKWKSFTDALEESKTLLEKAYLDTPHQLNALVRCTPVHNVSKAFDMEENFIIWRVMTKAPELTKMVTEAHYSYAWNELSLPKIFPILGSSQEERAEVGKMIVYEAEKKTAEKSLDRIRKLFGEDFDIVKETVSINWKTIKELGVASILRTSDLNEMYNADAAAAKRTVMNRIAETIEPVTVGDKKVSEKEMLNKFKERINDILGEHHRSSVLYNLLDRTTERDQVKYKIEGSTLKKKVNKKARRL